MNKSILNSFFIGRKKISFKVFTIDNSNFKSAINEKQLQKLNTGT